MLPLTHLVNMPIQQEETMQEYDVIIIGSQR
jgi:hypothetical protein